MGVVDIFCVVVVDQLKIWFERVGCYFYSKGMNIDFVVVVFEMVCYVIDNKCDVVIIDMAGCLYMKFNLMKELMKICQSVSKSMFSVLYEVLFVLDVIIGQNVVEQVIYFIKVIDVLVLVFIKLDGIVKGGVVIGIFD